ncbi:putative polyketide hydroxylase [Actinacidiphila reveromycinica]|uniref:Putative polyketide hydroxylase n=1 Tax=Actinacidiphila reveromycinica TaxID=659352 RepID=A0A7U3VNG7_9ACTN|nr:FAD-dependent monooxygenase [Streptomyces sp. SN-593]BBA97549.1 putative polyketide hydroxylase [Streptomyces sp. SN-593]
MTKTPHPAPPPDRDGGTDERVPVLIAGGSLVGLSASLFLGRLGVPHLLVERHARTSHHPRGRGNNVRTMELFRAAGVEDRVRAAASVLAGNHGILQADTLTGAEQEWLFRTIDPGGSISRISPSGWCLCSQNDLEPVLLAAARELGGDIRFGTELVSFAQDADGVTAQIVDRASGGSRTVRADYLVAADGPRSPIRERLGIPMTGPGALFHNVSVTFRAKRLADAVGDRRFIVCYLTNPESPGALLPVDNAQDWVFHAPWRPDDGESLDDFTDERCAHLIRTAVGVPDLEVEITGRAPWHAAERVAERYGSGRVLLAGDSAHEMSPTGAFGSNTGIQDAHNLAWKLAAVLAGWAGPGLLDSYDAERRPVALATAARASARSAEHSHPGYDAAPVAAGPRAGMMPAVLGYRYPVGAVLGADPRQSAVPPEFSPLAVPGGRAPHLWVRRDGERISTLDLYEHTPVLLTGPQGGAWYDAARLAAERIGVPLDRYRLGRELEIHPGDAGEAEDAVGSGRPGGAGGAGGPGGSGEAGGPGGAGRPGGPAPDFCALHGIREEGAVLVRPDGFVAWRSEGARPDPESVLRAALAEVFHRG